jgi:hypothetical protein
MAQYFIHAMETGIILWNAMFHAMKKNVIYGAAKSYAAAT